MEIKSALTLATFALAELAIDGRARQEPEEWLKELESAKQIINQIIDRPAPERFFMSAAGRAKSVQKKELEMSDLNSIIQKGIERTKGGLGPGRKTVKFASQEQADKFIAAIARGFQDVINAQLATAAKALTAGVSKEKAAPPSGAGHFYQPLDKGSFQADIDNYHRNGGQRK